jgi:hypothetical protein
MASAIQSEIQARLAQYLDRKIELHEFEDWFVPVLWDIAESDDEDARALAGHIHNLLAEFSRGDRTSDSLQEELENAARPFASKWEIASTGIFLLKNDRSVYAIASGKTEVWRDDSVEAIHKPPMSVPSATLSFVQVAEPA